MIYLFCCHFCLCLSFCSVKSIYTLYGCSLLRRVCIDVEPNQDCSRAGPFISKHALSAQLTQGAPRPALASCKPCRPSKDKPQVLITTSTSSCSHPGDHRDHSSWAPTQLHGESGKICLKPCHWKLSSSVRLWVFWKVCARCLTFWLWYGWVTHLGSSSFSFPIFKERYCLLTPEH